MTKSSLKTATRNDRRQKMFHRKAVLNERAPPQDEPELVD
jgi:hypothetical protein